MSYGTTSANAALATLTFARFPSAQVCYCSRWRVAIRLQRRRHGQRQATLAAPHAGQGHPAGVVTLHSTLPELARPVLLPLPPQHTFSTAGPTLETFPPRLVCTPELHGAPLLPQQRHVSTCMCICILSTAVRFSALQMHVTPVCIAFFRLAFATPVVAFVFLVLFRLWQHVSKPMTIITAIP